jgi:hypothetical protein
LASQNEFFFNNPLDAKGYDKHALDYALHLSRLFSACPEPSMPFKHPCTAHVFFLERLSNHYQGLRHTFSNIYTKFDAVPLSDPSRNHSRPNTELQIEALKKSACPSSCVKFCILTPILCQYYHFQLNRTTETGIQMAAAVPEIMDTLS